jgi:hypothetical protein
MSQFLLIEMLGNFIFLLSQTILEIMFFGTDWHFTISTPTNIIFSALSYVIASHPKNSVLLLNQISLFESQGFYILVLPSELLHRNPGKYIYSLIDNHKYIRDKTILKKLHSHT